MSNLPKIILAIESYRAYDRELLKGISQYAKQNGPWLLFHETDDVFKSLSDIEKIKPDGIVVRISKNGRVLEKIPDFLPCIVLGSGSVCDGRINVIGNFEKMGQMAAEYLLSLGFKDFGFCGTNHAVWSCERAESFTMAIQDAGFNVNYYSCPDKSKTDFARELTTMAQWIESLPKPIGIMASNDDRGFAVLEACKALGVDVPGQVAVLGVDNDIANCELAMPPLSSIALNTVKAGFEAARILDRMMRKGVCCGYEKVIVEPTHIVPRQSTNVLAVSDIIVAKALDFIRNNVKIQIQVNDVAESVSVSRRELERRFKKRLNSSIHQEIKLARVQLITKMLLETSDSISEIAAKLGFVDVNHIGRYFRDIEGISPVEYRKKNLCTV
ncbi:MAG: DNA-binding transcriptional regulator [Phycisphaerae bacterium]|jgi:LacI family transcriptional regulator